MTHTMDQRLAARMSALRAGCVLICGRASFVYTNVMDTKTGLI
jgi:hypothetical protein